MGAIEAVHFIYFDTSDRAIPFADGKSEVYSIGFSAAAGRVPSEDLLSIFAEYAAAADGLSL